MVDQGINILIVASEGIGIDAETIAKAAKNLQGAIIMIDKDKELDSSPCLSEKMEPLLPRDIYFEPPVQKK